MSDEHPTKVPAMTAALHDDLRDSARRFPHRVAVEESTEGSLTYADLERLTGRLRDRLRALGVRPGDRVGLCLRKSADAIATLFGILKAGAAYIPTDPTAPASRNAYILRNGEVAALVVEAPFRDGLLAAFRDGAAPPPMLVLDGVGSGVPLTRALDQLDQERPAPATVDAPAEPSSLAYILYTSGSTGRPKGVMLTHGNAGSFVDWCSETFRPDEHDRFSSHAPLHFDLSVLDVFVSLKHGATLVLVEEALGKDPARLAPWIAGRRLTVWYSAPSILGLMAEYGRLDELDCSSLRAVLFAGEVFPIKHLRRLMTLWPHPRYYNLYGPTETNVCTWYEVPGPIPESQADPVPIGRACAHCRPLVVDPDGVEVSPGAEGELCIAGPSVMQGYWRLPEPTEGAFLPGREGRWYRTGDIVAENPGGNYRFLGRRDRMVKRRGYRIELGEIEAALYRHPAIREAAAVAASDDAGVRITAYLSTRDGGRLSAIALKRFCSRNLPVYMVPDGFRCLDTLPKTSTDKIDYQRLMESP